MPPVRCCGPALRTAVSVSVCLGWGRVGPGRCVFQWKYSAVLRHNPNTNRGMFFSEDWFGELPLLWLAHDTSQSIQAAAPTYFDPRTLLSSVVHSLDAWNSQVFNGHWTLLGHNFRGGKNVWNFLIGGRIIRIISRILDNQRFIYLGTVLGQHSPHHHLTLVISSRIRSEIEGLFSCDWQSAIDPIPSSIDNPWGGNTYLHFVSLSVSPNCTELVIHSSPGGSSYTCFLCVTSSDTGSNSSSGSK